PRSKRKPLIIAAAVVLVAGLAAGGYAIYSKATAPKPIAAAATKCNLKAEVGDDGHTLSMFNVGAQEDQFPGPDGLDGLVCVTKALNMPARAFDHMLS